MARPDSEGAKVPLCPTGLPGPVLYPLPAELDQWRARQCGNVVCSVDGAIVLCRADGVHRTFPTLSAACASVAR